MRRFFGATLVLGSLLAGPASAQPPVTAIAAEKGKTVKVAGKLEHGKPLASLDWAWKSSMACFPGTEQQKYAGNHVFFSATIPPKSEMVITVVPKDPSVNMSAYAYEVAPGKEVFPPDVSSAVSCEAESKWDRPKRGKSQDHTRVLPRLTAIANPYAVIIGVTSPKEVTSGDFELQIEVR